MSQCFQVLVIEDDKTLGPLIIKALKQAGIDAQLSQTPEAAQTLCSHCDFPLILADLMLPRMDGVTLIQQLLPTLSRKPDILLMTGVFKDRGFLTDARKKTGALEIFSKPFEMEELIRTINHLKSRSQAANAPSKAGLAELFCHTDPLAEEINEFCAEAENLPGLQVPFLLSLLLETKWTGSLHIQRPQRASGVVYLDEGVITQVFLDDAKSLLGHLLMDLGFVEPDDLQAALANKDGTLIGQKLIHQLSISPHALDLALSEQTALRLSQLIVPEIVQVRFSPDVKVPPNKAHAIPQKRLHQLFREWGDSKYEISDLEDFFSLSLSLPVHPFSPSTSLEQLCRREPCGPLVERLLKREILPTAPVAVDDNIENLRNKYVRLEESMKAKNHFDVLGISPKAVSKEIEKAYLSLKSSVKSNMQSIKDPSLVEICERIHKRIEKAYATLVDDIKRGQYLNQIEAEQQQKMMAKEPEYNLAVALLEERRFKDALDIFQRLAHQKLNFPDLTAHLIIAKARAQKKAVMEGELAKISPENRQSGAYMMAKAYVYKGTKSYPMAIQYFRKALVYNQNSKLANYEIASCMRRQSQIRKEHGSLLGGFVDGLLGNSSKSSKRRKAS